MSEFQSFLRVIGDVIVTVLDYTVHLCRIVALIIACALPHRYNAYRLFIYLSIYSFICLFVCLLVCSFVCNSLHLLTSCLSIYLSIYLSCLPPLPYHRIHELYTERKNVMEGGYAFMAAITTVCMYLTCSIHSF